MKIDGREIARDILEDLKKRVGELKKLDIIPHLAIILVGDDPASVAYVRQKKLKAEEIGSIVTIEHLSPNITQQQLLSIIEQLNNNNDMHGIIVQQPLPSHIDSKAIDQATDPTKDIDGFHPNSPFPMPLAEAVLKILKYINQLEITKRGVTRLEGLPTTSNVAGSASTGGTEAEGRVRLLDRRGGKSGQDPERWLRSKTIVVIGKGETGGKPIITRLQEMGIEPVIIDSKTKNPAELTKKADIIISAVGKSNIVKPEMIKKGVILISVGLHKKKDGKLQGDYNEEEIKDLASFYTPTPSGVGPVNVAMLLENLVLAAGKN